MIAFLLPTFNVEGNWTMTKSKAIVWSFDDNNLFFLPITVLNPKLFCNFAGKYHQNF